MKKIDECGILLKWWESTFGFLSWGPYWGDSHFMYYNIIKQSVFKGMICFLWFIMLPGCGHRNWFW